MKRKNLTPSEANTIFSTHLVTKGIANVVMGEFVVSLLFKDGTEICISAKSKTGDLDYFLITRGD